MNLIHMIDDPCQIMYSVELVKRLIREQHSKRRRKKIGFKPITVYSNNVIYVSFCNGNKD